MILSFLYTALSTLLSVAVAFASAGKAAETPGTPTWNAAAYTTFGPASAPRYDITFDEVFTEAFELLTEETGFDLPGVAAGLPDFFYRQRWMVKLLPGLFYSLRDKGLKNESGWGIFGALAGMPTKLHLKAEPLAGRPGEYRAVIEMTHADGSVVPYDTGAVYNAATGDLSARKGIFNLGFNVNLKEKWAYTAQDPPMRLLGYMKLYDTMLLKNTAVNADTLRLKFPYRGKDWMVQLWKGRYFNTSGGEVGLYHKPTTRLTEVYDTASSERIGMSFEIYIKKTGEPLIVRPVENHWWMTGFAMNRVLYLADQLVLKTEIVPADQAMMDGLIFALEREAAGKGATFEKSADGTRLFIEW